MSDYLAKRIAEALENLPLEATEAVVYRSAMQNPDPTDVTSMASVAIFRPDQFKAVTIHGRFSHYNGVATICVNRGYSPTGTTSFVCFGREIYTLTAVGSGNTTVASLFLSNQEAFSCWRASGLKITLAATVSTGTMDLWVQRY